MYRLQASGEKVIEIEDELNPYLQIAEHYRTEFATSPAGQRSGEEPVVIYRPKGFNFPVLMGMFGSRRRNEYLIGAQSGLGAHHLAQCLSSSVEPVWIPNAPCHEHRLENNLDALPVLTTTSKDAGPYLTSGVVCAGSPRSGFFNVSIHRMRLLDSRHLTIWMLPGRDLEVLYHQAVSEGRSLPVSINIGVSPALYFASSLSKPFVTPGSGELEVAGALLRQPLAIAQCVTCETFCIAESEIVVEGFIRGEMADEFSDPFSRYGMPEFLGYMGQAQELLPVVEVTGVFHRSDAIYQTFLGPGKEQAEMLALPTEAGVLRHLKQFFKEEIDIVDVHYLAPGGGQLMAALRVRKSYESKDLFERIRDSVIACHALTKIVIVADEDTDIHSPEDLLWAFATRFQPSRDLYILGRSKGFPLDPSQRMGYLDPCSSITDKYLIDLTAPKEMRLAFERV
nr:UbiD family decarboxylase [Herbaspirillum sp. ASV7]